MPNFGVIVIPMLEDNYSYYIHKMKNLSEGFFIDVGEYDKVEEFKQTFQIKSEKYSIIPVVIIWGGDPIFAMGVVKVAGNGAKQCDEE